MNEFLQSEECDTYVFLFFCELTSREEAVFVSFLFLYNMFFTHRRFL